MTASSCPNACREQPAWELFASERGFRLLRCPECGLGWTDPPLGDEEIGAFYPPAWYGENNVRFNPVFEALVRLFRQRRSAVIRRRSKPGPVLDVGCGRGLILGELKRRGYRPYGVELSEHAARHAVHQAGAEVHVGDLQRAPFPENYFEVVIFWHSLEHFREPLKALDKASRLLKPGGLLVVAVPNSESLQARLSGANWFHLDIPRHYFHFGLEPLRRAVQDRGFRIAQIDHFSFEQNPYGWLQSLYNALGFRFNFLYDFLKNSNARMTPLRKHPVQALGVLLLLPVLLPVALILMAYEAAAEEGGTVELYAIKKA
ncbi:MAG: hypothetical protein AUJ52_14620 [Elusimicrobia bacterium CG1_02_63_36]|nr:MAG: hypothetical protein AUJ52_14620 [Elusimicrobia bacterium CG1_02_63_36]